MPGRTPKPDALRARTNSESASLVLVADPDRAVPALPTIRDWQQHTRDLWDTLWTSAMAQMFTDADMLGLVRLAICTDDYFRSETASERLSLSAEIRQLEKQFGLNPEARTKLRWLVYEAESARKRVEEEKPPRPITADRNILFES